MNFEVTITVVKYRTDESGEVIHTGMMPRRKKFSAYYQIPRWLSPDGNLVSHGDTEEEAVEKLKEMIKVFHADTLLTSMSERTMDFNNNDDPTEFNIGDFYRAPEICLDCVKCRFMNVKGARFCASCGAELVVMKNVPAVKLPNVVDVAIKRISDTNRLGNRVLLLTTILVRFKEIIGDEGVSPDAKLSEMRQLLVDHKI
jgi:hypothetical protein